MQLATRQASLQTFCCSVAAQQLFSSCFASREVRDLAFHHPTEKRGSCAKLSGDSKKEKDFLSSPQEDLEGTSWLPQTPQVALGHAIKSPHPLLNTLSSLTSTSLNCGC